MSDSGFDYGYVQDGKVYLKGYLDFPDREIGVVKESEQQSLQYFVDRFDIAQKKVEDVKKAVEENTNKGSFLMKIIHLKTYLKEFSGLGDFVALLETLEELEKGIEEYIQTNRVKNTEVKLALLKEAEGLKESTDWQNTSQVMKDLKMNWIKTGSAQKDIDDEIKERFDQALDYFFAQRKKHFDAQKKVIAERRIQYTNVVRKLKKLNAEAPENGEEIAAQLQEEWDAVGKVHPKKISTLITEFNKEMLRFQTDTLIRIQRSKKSGIELKRDIYERVSKMYDENNMTIPVIKRFQKEWKHVGRLPDEEDRDLNLKFRILCNEIFETHFLENDVKKNHQEYNSLSLTEKIKLKIRVLKESLKTDEYELGMFNTKFYKIKAKEKDPDTLRQLNKERGAYINKIKTKQRILKRLQDQLFTSY